MQTIKVKYKPKHICLLSLFFNLEHFKVLGTCWLSWETVLQLKPWQCCPVTKATGWYVKLGHVQLFLREGPSCPTVHRAFNQEDLWAWWEPAEQGAGRGPRSLLWAISNPGTYLLSKRPHSGSFEGLSSCGELRLRIFICFAFFAFIFNFFNLSISWLNCIFFNTLCVLLEVFKKSVCLFYINLFIYNIWGYKQRPTKWEKQSQFIQSLL